MAPRNGWQQPTAATAPALAAAAETFFFENCLGKSSMANILCNLQISSRGAAAAAVVNGSSTAGNGSSDSPLISKETGSSSPGSVRRRTRRHRRKRPTDEDEEDEEDEDSEEDNEEGREEDTPEHEMEYCDPCYCYGKCCLDLVASIFCVSLL